MAADSRCMGLSGRIAARLQFRASHTKLRGGAAMQIVEGTSSRYGFYPAKRASPEARCPFRGLRNCVALFPVKRRPLRFPRRRCVNVGPSERTNLTP